jgi:peptide/nickel transport system permease protein
MNTPAASMASAGLWTLAWRRLLRDRVGMVSLALVCGYLLIVIAAAAGIVAGDWAREAGVNYASPVFVGAGDSAPQAIAAVPAAPAVPSEPGIVDPLAGVLAELRQNLAAAPPEPPRAATLPLGGDKWGRDVLKKAVKGTETSMIVGLVAALLAVAIATVMGAYAGYYGGRIDDFLNWLYSVFTAIPYLGLTGWTGIFRLVRAEYIKHRSREYVLAADAVGASDAQRMFVHILPNVSHVVLVQLSLHVVLFIKMEVILSFLGFGVGVDTVSWGSMLNESQAELILGKWWQLAAATVAMAVLVTAFSLFTDALRDALDPRLK